MRAVALVIGGLLLVGGAALVVSADQQRAQALDDVRSAVVEQRQLLEAKKESNYRLAETLTGVRATIAEQDAQLSDTTGLLP